MQGPVLSGMRCGMRARALTEHQVKRLQAELERLKTEGLLEPLVTELGVQGNVGYRYGLALAQCLLEAEACMMVPEPELPTYDELLGATRRKPDRP